MLRIGIGDNCQNDKIKLAINQGYYAGFLLKVRTNSGNRGKAVPLYKCI